MSITQKWLRQNVQPYPDQNRVYTDIDAALARFPTFRPKSDVYTFDDGRTQLLLCVHGILPISFRGASYNIPMAIWIPREYPKHPPIAYVVPTNDMLVKAGKFVDVSGRSHIDYIQHWERKDEGCTLSALLEALQDHFSREPPVYSKPKDTSARYADRPPPPVPPSAAVVGAPPSRPALPSKPPSMSLTAPPPPPPPLPPHLHQQGHFGFGPSPTYSSVGPAPPPFRGNSPAANSFSPPPPPLLAPNLPASPPPPVPPQSHVVPSYAHVHRPPPLQQLQHQPPPPQRAPIPDLLDQDDTTSNNSYSAAVGLSGLAASAAAAAAATSPGAFTFPAPPPRPPNPELLRLQTAVHQKLTSELNSLSQALALDAERLRAHQADLLAGEPAIKDETARLEAVRDVCRGVAGRTRHAVQQAEANIAELKRKGDPEVDELVCATTIVHNQLINLIADDNAIEDTIYHLHRALNAGRIDLERFLRSTRLLAEEQFMKRALIEKIQNSI